ncbi:unnamed protein product [Medioppia subpectinata]|uniref:Uncharacterized protein n=1 Tax=Medioppia subpectinata TaxID=1979941 RepID=A0A7R9LD29_9ACAR|nr:unnamed protein product [Medioppia subpectinata]CAG2117810.1 unnamed protein product [Medioppia subpectinata]
MNCQWIACQTYPSLLSVTGCLAADNRRVDPMRWTCNKCQDFEEMSSLLCPLFGCISLHIVGKERELKEANLPKIWQMFDNGFHCLKSDFSASDHWAVVFAVFAAKPVTDFNGLQINRASDVSNVMVCNIGTFVESNGQRLSPLKRLLSAIAELL